MKNHHSSKFIKFSQYVLMLCCVINVSLVFASDLGGKFDVIVIDINQDVDIQTAVVNNDIPAVKKYIAAKKNLNEKEPLGGSTLLITAALFGKTEIAKLLIDAGADVNLKNNDGSTALHTSALFCRTDIIKMLLNKRADKSIKNKYGNTAYELVSGPYDKMKGIYEYMEKMLSPMGLKLDYAYIEKTRPVVANLLK